MIAFIPIATHALHVPFDSAFVYLGYLPDFYNIPEPDDESEENGNFFSIGRLYFPFHRSFGVGVRKPRFVSDSYCSSIKYMGKDCLLTEVMCLNIKPHLYCSFSSRLPIIQSEIEKVIILGKIFEQSDNYNSKDSSSNDFLFSSFIIAGTNRSWGHYMCITLKDQELILDCILNPSHGRRIGFSMMPVDSFYRSSVESSFSDSQKDFLWSKRLNLSSYASLRSVYRS
jgi:hypothetical protein